MGFCLVKPIYGHSFSEPLTVCQTKEADIFFYNDPEVNLPNFGVSSQVVNHTGRTVLKGILCFSYLEISRKKMEETDIFVL